MTDGCFAQARPGPVRRVDLRDDPSARAGRSRSRSWATARCGSAGLPQADLNCVEPILDADRDAAGGHRDRQHLDGAGRPTSPSPITASRTPTPAGSCSASASGIPSTPSEYRKPYDALVEYLDELDARRCRPAAGCVAALGPKVLKLSARTQRGRAPVPDDAGAHRAGARADRQHGVSGARAQGGADRPMPTRPARSAARPSTSTWT